MAHYNPSKETRKSPGWTVTAQVVSTLRLYISRSETESNGANRGSVARLNKNIEIQVPPSRPF